MGIFNNTVIQESGSYIILQSKRNPSNVPIVESNGKYYISAKDIDTFMEAALINNPVDAINQVCEASGLNSTSNVVIVGVMNEDAVLLLEQNGIVLEKSSYSDSMTPQMARKWYKKFVRKCESGIMDKSDLIERIDILKQCKASMEKELKKLQYRSTNDQIKYVLKDWIPFNGLVRFFRNKDTTAGWAVLANGLSGLLTAGLVPGGMIVRAVMYEEMLEEQLDYTNEAIEFLEKKLKEYK